MQRIRNFLFYFAPLAGAVCGGVAAFFFHAFFWVFGVLIGLGVGCLVSVFMIILSVRARFKADASLTQNALEKDNSSNSETV